MTNLPLTYTPPKKSYYFNLVRQQKMPLGECPTPHILPAKPHVEPLAEEGADGERFI